jgi:recombination protein RecA
VDEVLEGGLPVGAITEMVGPECSGRTSLALSFLARVTQAANVCAWIDVSDVFDPGSAVAAGVDLSRLLWVRCGVLAHKAQQTAKENFTLPDKLIPPATKKGVHGGGFGPHPRGEVKGLSSAVSSFLRPETVAPRCAEPQRRVRREPEVFKPNQRSVIQRWSRPATSRKPWSRIEQALQTTDLILQGGGFSAIVLDMGSIAPEHASRVQLATWFCYRAAAENSQASFLLLTQHSCAKSSAELVLRFHPGDPLTNDATVFTGIEHRLESGASAFHAASGQCSPASEAPAERECGELVHPKHMGRCPMKLAELYACLYAKEFPAQTLLRLRPELRDRPCVVMEGEPPLQRVCSINTKGRLLRITHGMTSVEVDTFPSVTVFLELGKDGMRAVEFWSG